MLDVLVPPAHPIAGQSVDTASAWSREQVTALHTADAR
jgi:hypothetical protein